MIIGIGDELLGAGIAKGARARGKRIAFGDGRRIIWSIYAREIFRGNPNVAPPGSTGKDLEWCHHYSGHRLYNRHEPSRRRWIWNYDFKAKPGELFFDNEELAFAKSINPGFVLIEPNVPQQKAVAPNKQWPADRFQKVASALTAAGYKVVQFDYGGRFKLSHVHALPTKNARYALAALSRAALYIGPEGGLHHGAAAVDTAAIVLFGGFIPPAVTGYDNHLNLVGNSEEACGSLRKCDHCLRAMQAIEPEQVIEAAMRQLKCAPSMISA